MAGADSADVVQADLPGVPSDNQPILSPTVIQDSEYGLSIDSIVPPTIHSLADRDGQKAPPVIAKSRNYIAEINKAIRLFPTRHILNHADARDLSSIPNASVHLIVTSPPYWTLKQYPENSSQLGHIADYEDFLNELDRVWAEAFRVLVPGGRLVVVVGDVCLSRRQYGRHVVFPLHASIQERCRALGFDNLAPIIWYKISNAKLEVDNGSRFLGKPYEPNAVVKNDIEYILFQRKSPGYRQPSLASRLLSVIPEELHREWFQQVWRLGGTPTRKHPAPYSYQLAERLVRMFSFVGDTVLDPFMGTGTTNLVARQWGRDSIGYEIDSSYFSMALNRLHNNELGGR